MGLKEWGQGNFLGVLKYVAHRNLTEIPQRGDTNVSASEQKVNPCYITFCDVRGKDLLCLH